MSVAAGEGPDVLHQALVYLGAAVVAVPVAQRLGLGSVLGYLLAGIAVGPAALDLVGNPEAVMHFAEFGVVMMLFLIGLELRPRVLWRMRATVLGLGGLQVLVTALAVAAAALVLGRTRPEALAVGLTLALSSTAIVMQSLSERGIERTEAGRGAFGVLLFQDIAVIPILALLPLLASPGAQPSGGSGPLADLPGWAHTLVVLAAVAGVVVGGRVLTRPLFRAVAGTRLRELFSACALLLVVGISVLMGTVGLSPALGTFLAGVVLADSEYRHELEGDLEPFKGLLLGLFFITVGAGIDFGLVAREPLTVVGLVAGLLVLKAGVLNGLARAWRLSPPARWTFTLALPQAGEFGFVLLATTASQGILPDDLGRLLVVVVALSMALTPLLLLVDQHLVQPRFARGPVAPADAAPPEAAPVVVAGFGRFGQIVGRLLRANGFRTAVLDLDARSIEVLRAHGLEVHYGDAARPELLEAAGCAEAHLFVLAVDDVEHAHLVAETVRRHYPHLPIVARARDTRAAHALHGLGGIETVCEATGSGLELGDAALRRLGLDPYRALRATRRFHRHERETQQQLFAAWGDPTRTLQVARARVADLDRLLDADEQDESLAIDRSWEAPGEVEQARDLPASE